jgi:hypothetical protein
VIVGFGVAVLALYAMTTTQWAYGTARATAERLGEPPRGGRYAAGEAAAG